MGREHEGYSASPYMPHNAPKNVQVGLHDVVPSMQHIEEECIPAGQMQEAPVLEASRPKSEFRGLSWDRKHEGWRVRIYYRSKQRHIGRYTDEVEAAKAYDKAAYYLYGDAAITNFGLEAVRKDTTEVSTFIIQAKQQVQANDQHPPHYGQGVMAGQGDGLLVGQQSTMQSMGLWQQQQLYHASMMGAGHPGEATGAVHSLPFHGSSYHSLANEAQNNSSLYYANPAPVAPQMAVPGQQQLLVVASTPAGQPLAGASAMTWLGSNMDALQQLVPSLATQVEPYSLSSATTVQQQQQQQFTMPAATAAAAIGSSISSGMPPQLATQQFLPSMPMVPQQQLLYHGPSAEGHLLLQPQQQQLPHQLLGYQAGSEPLQLSVQPQMMSIAAHVNTSAAQAAMAGTVGSNSPRLHQPRQQQQPQQQQQQHLLSVPLLMQQMQDLSMVERQSSVAAGHHQRQLFGPQCTSQVFDGSGGPPAAAAGQPQQGIAQPLAAVVSAPGTSPLAAPFAAAVALQGGQQGEACRLMLTKQGLHSAQSSSYSLPRAAVVVGMPEQQAPRQFPYLIQPNQLQPHPQQP